MVRIVTESFPELSSRQTLVYIGLLTVIDKLKSLGETVTSRRLAEEIQGDEANIGKIINEMVSKGILRKHKIPNRLGRGVAYELEFEDTPLLRQLLGLGGSRGEQDAG